MKSVLVLLKAHHATAELRRMQTGKFVACQATSFVRLNRSHTLILINDPRWSLIGTAVASFMASVDQARQRSLAHVRPAILSIQSSWWINSVLQWFAPG